MVFNATFNNISFILWRSVLLVEETVVSRENHRSVSEHSKKNETKLVGLLQNGYRHNFIELHV